MPIFIPTTSRRNFLVQSLGLGATLLTFDLTQGAASEKKNCGPVVLLADTHMPADPKTNSRGSNMAKNLEQTVREILKVTPLPSAVVINGDCAQTKGLQGDYELLGKLLSPLSQAGIPIHLTMGNHDDRAVFRKTLDQKVNTKSEMEEKHVVLLKTPHVNWFLIDTLMEVNVVTGEVGAKQMEWLKKALENNDDKPAIVVGHHTPQINIPGSKFNKKKVATGIKDSKEFFNFLDTHKQIKAYCYGHSHTWKLSERKSGVHLVNQPPIGYVFSKDYPLGWLLALPNKKGISFIFNALDKGNENHAKITQLRWRS